MKAEAFQAKLEIIGANPFVSVPQPILSNIFEAAGKDKGAIPIMGTVNGKPYTQTLVRFKGAWRLYINTFMLKDSPRRIGEVIDVTVVFDGSDRTIKPHPRWTEALESNETARAVFDGLSSSRKREIVRYISALKTEESVERNVKRAIDFLLGDGRFVGRDKP
ncbi:MAG: YdeI/OmpD-associated family protein [Clostridiales Family XIII bacterium]|jgi:hypothetical protein|nr:YdeI/OmpD-associated family protein [Clostridiales Family XIII bacterium]